MVEIIKNNTVYIRMRLYTFLSYALFILWIVFSIIEVYVHIPNPIVVLISLIVPLSLSIVIFFIPLSSILFIPLYYFVTIFIPNIYVMKFSIILLWIALMIMDVELIIRKLIMSQPFNEKV